MPEHHQFQIGQAVEFSPTGRRPQGEGRYTIVRLLRWTAILPSIELSTRPMGMSAWFARTSSAPDSCLQNYSTIIAMLNWIKYNDW